MDVLSELCCVLLVYGAFLEPATECEEERLIEEGKPPPGDRMKRD